jgi:uncharacterized protein
MQDPGQPLVIWRFTDGKAGHENQSAGLLTALRAHQPVEDFLFHTAECHKGMLACIRGDDPYGSEKPDPGLIIGAGHATHLPMLNARRMRGGKVIVLMKPSLPNGWFDLCVIPAHDRPHHADNVLVTQGVLNRVQPGTAHDPGRGLILVGGPSAHVDWQDEPVIAQLRDIVTSSPDVQWQLATSRRTPERFLGSLAGRVPANLALVPAAETGPDWLPQQLAQAGQVWVTDDSVSMVYEALTSGAAVGLIEVPYRKPQDRLAQGLGELARHHLVTRMAGWRSGQALQVPARSFNEAARCADWIAEHWLRAD